MSVTNAGVSHIRFSPIEAAIVRLDHNLTFVVWAERGIDVAFIGVFDSVDVFGLVGLAELLVIGDMVESLVVVGSWSAA
jgi:hypothetical protein